MDFCLDYVNKILKNNNNMSEKNVGTIKLNAC